MTNKQLIINIQNLNHFYGKKKLKKQVLFDIKLNIYSGEIILLTGPSGSGKTTLLSLIGGLLSVQEGSVNILGMVFEDECTNSFFIHM